MACGSGTAARLLGWRRRFHLHLHRGKEIVGAAFGRLARRKPTSRQHGRISYQVESKKIVSVNCIFCSRRRRRISGAAYFGSHEFGSTAEGASGRAIPHLFFAKTIIGDFDVTI